MRVATSGVVARSHKVSTMAEIPVLEAAPGQEGAATPKKFKLLLIIVAAVVVLAGGGGAAWFFMSKGDAKKTETTKHEEPAPTGPALYVALDPPFVVNF